MEGNATITHIDFVAGDHIAVDAIANIANADALIAADGQPDHGIALTIVVIADETHAAAPFVDVAHRPFARRERLGGSGSKRLMCWYSEWLWVWPIRSLVRWSPK